MMSQDFTNPALEQLFRLAPSADVQSTSEEVQAFIEQGGSVFDLLKLGRKGVVDTFGLHSLDAQTLMDKATSLRCMWRGSFASSAWCAMCPPIHCTRPALRRGWTRPASTTCSNPIGKTSALPTVSARRSRRPRIL